ncbi:MAG: M23 family metallopeptidase [Acidobacteria bacterium]|nr:M23 family metallopeptidase [Acidobacteriota bacterium]
MLSNRYTIVVADRRSGVVRRFTVGLRPLLSVVTMVLALPVLIGFGAAWKAKAEVGGIYATNAALELENSSFRGATEALTGQITALQTAISDLGGKAALDPALQAAMDRLPAIVKNRAMGGAASGGALTSLTPGLGSPEDTFGLLRDLLQGIENRLRLVSTGVDRRNALAAATPSLWPTHGWLSSGTGGRSDPFTGEADFHPGLDISADRGTPVYATADGVVSQAAFSGAYGNLVVIDHKFGVETRYGHLSAFRTQRGQSVKRGDLIGLVGSTGRATGPHLHYEVRVSGRILNPLRFLLNPRGTSAD